MSTIAYGVQQRRRRPALLLVAAALLFACACLSLAVAAIAPGIRLAGAVASPFPAPTRAMPAL